MYALFLDKSARDSSALQAYLATWKQTQKIISEDYLIDNVEQITTICREHGKKYSTIIGIGSEATFQSLISESRYFDDKVVLAYIPTAVDTLTKRLGIKDYKDGCSIVAQRKIIELTALSINQKYFLFDYRIDVVRGATKDSPTTHIHLDKTMQIDLPTDVMIIHNRNQELLPHNSPLLLEAYSQKNLSSDKRNVLKLATQHLHNMGEDEKRLQLRVPAHTLQIDSSSELVDEYNHKLKTPIVVGSQKKSIRLIVKKGQELQAILSPGLIS